MGGFFGRQATAGGYTMDECTSSLQKCIRRGMEKEAMYFAIEIETIQPNYLFNRLEVIAHEDIGLANPQAIMFSYTCKQQYLDMKKRKSGSTRLVVSNLILYMCRSPKSRLADHFNISRHRCPDRIGVPDFALDQHTSRGRRMKRGIEHFWTEGTVLANEVKLDGDDEYGAEARAYLDADLPRRYDGRDESGRPAHHQLGLGDDGE